MEELTTARRERARTALEGLAVGDAFGDRLFFQSRDFDYLVSSRELPGGMWEYTDDTQMALSLVEVLFERGAIDQERLARSFGERFERQRGYGTAMYDLLPRLARGAPWRESASALFGGSGSYGNGAAMRVAPLGAYFADDLDAVVEHARRSAEVTHAHPEAICGAIAVAGAAGLAARLRGAEAPRGSDFLDLVLPLIPASEVRAKTMQARELGAETHIHKVIIALGNGTAVTAQDTVPYVLWCAAQHLDSYVDALWLTASGFGDIDTTCAMVGGIVASYVGVAGIPPEWLRRREPLPEWAFPGAIG